MHLVHYEIFDVKLLNIYVCAINERNSFCQPQSQFIRQITKIRHHVSHLRRIPNTGQLDEFFQVLTHSSGNKTEWKGLTFLTPLCFHPFRWKHCTENTGKVSEEI